MSFLSLYIINNIVILMKNRHETSASNVISVKRLKLRQNFGDVSFPHATNQPRQRAHPLFPPTLTRPVNCPQNHCKLRHREYSSELYWSRQARGRKPSQAFPSFLRCQAVPRHQQSLTSSSTLPLKQYSSLFEIQLYPREDIEKIKSKISKKSVLILLITFLLFLS